jgi:MATE family multidrug resistance protein
VLFSCRRVGFDAQISRLVGRYCIVATPLAPGAFIQVVAGKFLQVQEQVKPLVIIGVIANVIHAVLAFGLVAKAGLGLDGSAIALVAANWTMAVCSVGTVAVLKVGTKCWRGFSWEALHGWVRAHHPHHQPSLT